MKLLVYISCVLAAAEFAVGGPDFLCNDACDCNVYCKGMGIPACRLRTMGELAGEKHCACDSCEDDNSNDDISDSNAGDRRKRSSDRVVCTDDCICKNYSCPDDEIAYCKKEKSSQGDRLCDCKACSGDSGDDDSDNDGDDDDDDD